MFLCSIQWNKYLVVSNLQHKKLITITALNVDMKKHTLHICLNKITNNATHRVSAWLPDNLNQQTECSDIK